MDPTATLWAWTFSTPFGSRAELALDYNNWVRNGGCPAKVVLKDTSSIHEVDRIRKGTLFLLDGSSCKRSDVREVLS